ncbi:MAG: hypothetical protein GYB51_20610, partial [Rhodobacteraceae bacterium]|nr:hypothetical protein [Paracoccaceae bacterium]
NLLDSSCESSPAQVLQQRPTKGTSPFTDLKVSEGGKIVTLGSAPTLKNPTGSTSKDIYADIQNNIESWIEESIQNRAKYK